MKKVIYSSENNNFTTFELHNADLLFTSAESINSSKRFIADLESKRKFGDELFEFINEAYDELGGFKSFKDMDRFINDSYLWYITYDGPQPAENELEINRVYVVSVFRRNHGLKMVGMARRKIARGGSSRSENIDVRARANAALTKHIKFTADRGWAEVSDKLESWFRRTLGSSYEINPEFLIQHKIFNDVEPDPYDNHYYRPLRKDGPMLYKIAYGTIRV